MCVECQIKTSTFAVPKKLGVKIIVATKTKTIKRNANNPTTSP